MASYLLKLLIHEYYSVQSEAMYSTLYNYMNTSYPSCPLVWQYMKYVFEHNIFHG